MMRLKGLEWLIDELSRYVRSKEKKAELLENIVKFTRMKEQIKLKYQKRWKGKILNKNSLPPFYLCLFKLS